VVDASGQIVLVNSKLESIFGYARSELVGKPLEMLLPERLKRSHIQHRQSYNAEPEAREMGAGRDLMARHRDGSEFAVEIGLSPMELSGRMLIMATVIDITTRKMIEARLQQINASLEEFTYVASHDLRSPIHGISELVTWIAEDLGEGMPDSVRRNLSRIDVRIKRVERMIEDLLLYARAGRYSSEQSLIEPDALIQRTLELLTIPEGFQISVDCTATPFNGARVPLETILRNLLSNALKHHDREQGCIAFRARDEGQFCVFEVADDGPGVPPGSAERIFKIFETVSASERGTSGVGLAVAKRLAESHGARVALLSEGAARGATFRVSWPRQPRRISNA